MTRQGVCATQGHCQECCQSKYQSIVKTGTTAAGIDGILVDPQAKRTHHYQKCAEALERLAAYKRNKEQQRAPEPRTDHEDSETNEPLTRCPSRSETPQRQRKPSDMDIVDITVDSDEGWEQQGRAQDREGSPRTFAEEDEGAFHDIILGQQLKEAAANWSVRRARQSEFHLTAHSTERKPPAPLQYLVESSSDNERNDSDKKERGTGGLRKKTQKSSTRKMTQELALLPQEARLSVHWFIGEPWEIEGDGLIVFTNNKYKIHN